MKIQDKLSSLTTVRMAGEKDAAALTAICRKTFFEAYEADNTPENMRLYLDTHFTEPLIQKELKSPDTWFFVSESDGRLTGYLALKKVDPPVPAEGQNFIEILRFYVDHDFQGKKLGAELMRASLDWVKKQGFDSVWLTVWKRNLKAVAVYEHFGFTVAGETTFTLGDDVQLDHVMIKHL